MYFGGEKGRKRVKYSVSLNKSSPPWDEVSEFPVRGNGDILKELHVQEPGRGKERFASKTSETKNQLLITAPVS